VVTLIYEDNCLHNHRQFSFGSILIIIKDGHLNWTVLVSFFCIGAALIFFRVAYYKSRDVGVH
jgi:hypothetical protein